MMIAKIINAAQKAYDDCYNNMESAKNGKCLGQAGGTKATEYLSEMCIDCPYFCLGMKDASLGSLDSINDSLKDSDDMNKIIVNSDDTVTPEPKFMCLFGDFAYFEDGSFKLNEEGIKILHDESKLITSYSGVNYWCNHFICELLDLYSGTSEYNYSLGTIQHQKEIAQGWNNNKDSIIQWFYTNSDKTWFILAEKSFDSFMINIRDNADIFK